MCLQFSTHGGAESQIDARCTGGFDFITRMYISLAYPAVLAVIMVILVLTFAIMDIAFFSITHITTVAVYTFGAQFISALTTPFPCYQAEAGKFKMLHNPSKECYSEETVMLLSSIGLFLYAGVAIYVLGIAFWRRKEIIRQPADHERSLVQSTYTAFAFL